MERLLLSVEEVAELLSLGRTKVFELIRRGELESISVGKARRVPLAAAKEFVERAREAQAR